MVTEIGTNNEEGAEEKSAISIDYAILDINLCPEKGKRLGLYLMGGSDQGFLPVIESVQQGSPASEATLEVGDQICYVDGADVAGLSHDEVAGLIHQAGNKGTITLKVKRRKADFDVQPYNSDDEDSGIVDNHLYKQNSESKSPNLRDNCGSPAEKLVNSSPEPVAMRESSANETSYISHSTFKPEVTQSNGLKKGASKADNISNGKGAMPLVDNGAYINGAFSPVEIERDVHEMAVDCPEDFEGTPKTRPKLPSVGSKEATAAAPVPVLQTQPSNGRSFGGLNSSARTRNEAVRYQQSEEIRRREEETKITREQEFLRGSLRESQKLKSLQKQRPRPAEPTVELTPGATPAAAFVNEAFDSGDDQQQHKSPVMGRALGPSEVEHCLETIDKKLGNAGDEVGKLLRSIRRRFEDERFKQILQVHKAVVESSGATGASAVSSDSGVRIEPTTSNAMQLVREVAEAVDRLPINPPAKQLHALLTTDAHLAALIDTHDEIAKMRSPQSESEAGKSPQIISPEDVSPRVMTPPPSAEDTEFILRKQAQYNESGLKVVRFDREGDAPLGATIHNAYDCVIIARIVKGSIVDKSSQLRVGDELLEVNGVEMRGKNVNDVCQMLTELTGSIVMLVLPNSESDQLLQQQREQPIEEDQIHLRALFNYEPEEDRLCPCRELGVMFRRGEILHVVHSNDPCWWQACRDGEEDQMPGIVPSKKFWEMREIKRIELEKEMFSEEQGQSTCCPSLSKKKATVETPEILSYEEVGQYYPQPYRKRPIVLIGPQHVGRHELRRRLLESDPDRFAPAIPHTTKARDAAEIDGRDYHFIDRKHFQTMDQQQQFIECGLYQGNLYGTSVRAVADVISSGRVCILNLNPESMERVRRPELKPYIIFIAPPPLAQLQQLTNKLNQKLTDDKLTEIIEAGRATDVKWGHLFDFVVVNQDIDRTFKLIMDEINRLDVEPQWVPSTWLAAPLGTLTDAPGTTTANEPPVSFSASSSVRGSQQGAPRERAINASPVASRA